MGKKISTLFTTRCNQCQGTGTDQEYQFTVCQTCKGDKYISIFRMPECMRGKVSHMRKLEIR
jgi:DnaJ-class molecular chaperone